MKHVSVELSAANRRGIYIPIGVGHAFGVPAGVGEATVSYLVSEGYDPAAEHAVSPLDPALDIDWAAHGVADSAGDVVLSDKDRAAPTVTEIERGGLALPSWNECRGWEKELRLAWEQAQSDAENLSLIHISEPTRPY